MSGALILNAEELFSGLFEALGPTVGHEANYQVALQRQLDLFSVGDVLREHIDKRTGKGGIDVVVRDANSLEITMAFEVKGGAYGDRNALNDTFTLDGYCSDFDRLSKLQSKDADCWMVAIDAVELGRGLNYRAQKGAIEHARERGIGFAYYAIGGTSATVLDREGNLHYPEVDTSQNPGNSYDGVRSMLVDRAVIAEALQIDGRFYEKEADIVGRLYSQLRAARCAPSQLSLETYFGFAPRTSMQQRPDLCIYEPTINGRFNLYPRGNRSLSNDKVKLENLCCMIEVKGSLTLRSFRDKALLKKYFSDIEKMRKWRSRITSASRQYQIETPPLDFIFIAVDHRKDGLSDLALEELFDVSHKAGIICHYIYHPLQD